MRRKDDCSCNRGGSFPLFGEGFTRRRFLRVTGTGLVASYFADVLSPSLLEGQTVVNPTLHNTARNCILIFLSGAPSQIDMWDLKEGAWTPPALQPTSYGDVRWPQGLLPETAKHLDKLTIIRSGLSWAAVHQLAQVWTQISRNPGGAMGGIAPHIGAVVALETQAARTETDILPGFIALNQVQAGAGYLSSEFAPFNIRADQNGLASLIHPDGAARLEDRWKLIHAIDSDRRTGALGRATSDMANFYDQGKVMIDSPDAEAIFSFSATEREKYGTSNFGDSLIVARNLVGARRGTRFVQVTFGGWDHHSDIYAAEGNSLLTLSKTFDTAVGALMTDLAATPGSESGKTLLDETFVLVLGEFGRTVGPLNVQAGRDHFLRMSAVFAGGGVRGGKIIGKTDPSGANAIEYGWKPNRDVRPEDITATLYSALGIDYTTIRRDDPLGRGFEYVPFAKDGTYQPIDELFG
jgi:hypothetical protein